MSLLKWGELISHSGRNLDFKLECEALTDEDWRCAALMIARIVEPFNAVVGVPRGGVILSNHLRSLVTSNVKRLLIVDDVLTSGESMEYVRKLNSYNPDRVIGAVLFNRGPLPEWIKSVFNLNENLW